MHIQITEKETLPGSAHGGGMLYGMSLAWLTEALPDLTLPTAYRYAIVLIFAALACLSLIWVLVLRKHLAESKRFAFNLDERYRQFLHDCPDTLLIVEEDGSIVSANPNASKLFQTDGQKLLAYTCFNFIDKVSLTGFRKKFQQCLDGKPMHCEAGIQTGNSSLIPIEITGSLQRTEEKKFIQLYIRDKSVQRETEQEVHSLYRQMEKTAAELDRNESMLAEQTQLAREKLIASINHRIRTPLDGIMGMGQLLSESDLSIDQHNYISTILNSSARLLRVIEAMGNDPENALEETEDGFTDLHAVAEDLSRSYDLLAIRKGIQFRCNCHDNVPSQVAAEGAKLSQVLTALLDEAFRCTKEGLVILNIECRDQTDEEAELYFQVIDTGMGIEKEIQTSILELADDGTDNGITAELSMSACKRLIRQMGGTINRIHSTGKGSTVSFSLTFPLSLPEPETERDGQVPSAGAPPASSLEDARVLVVDDNKVCQKIVAAMLQKAGARVTVADHGQDALTRITEQAHDVILMDCQMPVMDGYEATARIRSMPEPGNRVPIIALTAHSLKHELQACRDAGMDECLTKPIERRMLIGTVARFANNGRMETLVRKAS